MSAFDHEDRARTRSRDADAARAPDPGRVTLVETLGQLGAQSDVPGKSTLTDALPPLEAAAPSAAPGRIPPAVETVLSRAQGEPLPDVDQWNRRVGADLSNARIVRDESAAAAAAAVGARAFTVGNRVFFGRGFGPETDGGGLLAHELTHVAQQQGSTAPASWDSLRVLDHSDAREAAARAHDGGAATNNEQALAREAEPDINASQYREKFAKQIGDGITSYFANHDLPSGSRFLTFVGPLLPGPALVGVTGAELDAKLDIWLTKEKVLKCIDCARPKGIVQVTDGDKEWVEDKISDGPGRWYPDVATELGAALHAALRVSLDRIVPRYLRAAVARGIKEEAEAQACGTDVPTPERGDVIASAPIDLAVIDGLIAFAQFDYQGYRAMYPDEPGQLGELRHVDLALEAPKDGLFYARVSAPADATPEEVATALFGEPTYSGELKIVAPPLFGFTDGSKLVTEHAETLTAMGIDLNVQVYDWMSAAAKGPMADEIAKNQGNQQPSALGSKTMVLGALDESIAIIPTIEKSGDAFGMGKNPVVSSLAPLKKELDDRRSTLANANEDEVLGWAGQVEGQQAILTQVSFSFDRHASRLADLTKMVEDADVKIGGFNLPDHVREEMLVIAMQYADVVLLSKLPGTARVKLAGVEDRAGALPITFLEGTLATIQRSLDDARDAKHGAGDHASYDVGGMSSREQELKQRLAALRVQIKTDPEGAATELQAISKLVQDLQLETEMVANMDHIDAAWKALDDGISFWWTGLYTQYKAGKLKDRGNALHRRWKAIFDQWKTGDPEKQKQAKQDLESLRTDSELGEWLGEVKDILEDARIERLIGQFVALIAITVVTAGVGDLVAAGAAGWELSAGSTALLVGGAEAATFTLLNQVFLDSDHSFGHIAYELGTNWAMFGVMRRFQMFAEMAKLSKGASVTGSTLIMAASVFAKADLDKYLKDGRHLNEEEVKAIALQGMAMAIAMHAIAPAMKPMFAELEGAAYVFGTRLRMNNKTQRVLTEGFEGLKQTKDFNAARDLVTREKQWLEERITIFDEVAAQVDKEAQPGAKPKDGGIAAKIKMEPSELASMRSELQKNLDAAAKAELPLFNLEPKGAGLFTCPRETIRDVVSGLGEVTKTVVDPVTTVVKYEVKLSDGTTITVMEKVDPVADWLAHLKTEVSPEGLARLEIELKSKGPKELMDEFQGDAEAARKHFTHQGDTAPPKPQDTLDMYGEGTIPTDRNARWKYKDDPAHWKPERRALHDRLIAEAKKQAQSFADASAKGEPTLYAMRGNTAAGKTRAVSGNVPELQGPMKATKDMPHRSVNPDNFKPDLIKAGGGSLTSSQVHPESSMLAERLERELVDMKTSDGKELGNILIDKRLANIGDVQHFAAMAKTSGRKFVLYDVDAPLEASLAGVLERSPGGSDPLPPFNIVADGFVAVRGNRQAVVDLFISDPSLGTYEVYGTRPDGERVPAFTVKEGKLSIHDAELARQALTAPGDTAELFAQKPITEEGIQAFTAEMDAARGTKVGNLLRRYLGWTWKAALDAHAKEAPLLQPGGP